MEGVVYCGWEEAGIWDGETYCGRKKALWKWTAIAQGKGKGLFFCGFYVRKYVSVLRQRRKTKLCCVLREVVFGTPLNFFIFVVETIPLRRFNVVNFGGCLFFSKHGPHVWFLRGSTVVERVQKLTRRWRFLL